MTELQVLIGDIAIAGVKLRDGTTEDVIVRALPISKMGKFIELVEDEAKTIELCCDKPEGWVDRLTDESHLALLEAAREANFTRAVAWGNRQIAAGNDLLPLMKAITDQKKAILAGL